MITRNQENNPVQENGPEGKQVGFKHVQTVKMETVDGDDGRTQTFKMQSREAFKRRGCLLG